MRYHLLRAEVPFFEMDLTTAVKLPKLSRRSEMVPIYGTPFSFQSGDNQINAAVVEVVVAVSGTNARATAQKLELHRNALLEAEGIQLQQARLMLSGMKDEEEVEEGIGGLMLVHRFFLNTPIPLWLQPDGKYTRTALGGE